MIDNHNYEMALSLAKSTPADLKAAYEYLILASSNGDQRADYAIATWYLSGNEVVQRDEIRAFEILKSLERSNIAEACFDLAFSYDSGRGCRRNAGRAFSNYMKAGLLGDKEACQQIAQYYLEGVLVKYNKELFLTWKLRSEKSEQEISPAYRLRL